MTDINQPKTGREIEPVQEIANSQVGLRGIVPRDLAELYGLADIIAASDLAPKDFKGKPANCVIAMQMGLEIGLHCMQAIQSIAVINGRPSIYGDTALALCRASGKLKDYTQSEPIGEGEARKVIVTATRRDDGTKYSQSYSVADAKKARLWGKDGPWTTNPDRMMMWRARGFILRDGWGDVLKGMSIRELEEDVEMMKAADAKVVGSQATQDINAPKAGTEAPKPEPRRRTRTAATPPAATESAQTQGTDTAPAGEAASTPAPQAEPESDSYEASVAGKGPESAVSDTILAEVLRLMEGAEIDAQAVAEACFQLAICEQRTQPAAMAQTELLTLKKRFGEVVRKWNEIKERRGKLTPAR